MSAVENLHGCNFERINLLELKEIQIKILLNFLSFCDAYNLKYFVCYGTLLGAVRHGGYIPWDDDIDVMMPAKDYDFLIQNYNRFSDYYEIIDAGKFFNFYLPFAKLSQKNTILIEDVSSNFDRLGVNIDIFPLDTLPKSNVMSHITVFYFSLLKKMLTVKMVPLRKSRSNAKNIQLLILKALLIFINYKYLVLIITKSRDVLSRFGNGTKFACYVGIYNDRDIYEPDVFDRQVNLNFEGLRVNAPESYSKVLTKIYGDYMKLPPLEKRITHHHFEAYRRIKI